MIPNGCFQEEGARLLTVLEWRYHPEFVAWLRLAREAKVTLAGAQLAGLATMAVNTLKASLTSENEKVALDAAKEVLRLCGVGPEFTREGDLERKRENVVAAARWVADQLKDNEPARTAVLQLIEDVG